MLVYLHRRSAELENLPRPPVSPRLLGLEVTLVAMGLLADFQAWPKGPWVLQMLVLSYDAGGKQGGRH